VRFLRLFLRVYFTCLDAYPTRSCAHPRNPNVVHHCLIIRANLALRQDNDMITLQEFLHSFLFRSHSRPFLEISMRLFPPYCYFWQVSDFGFRYTLGDANVFSGTDIHKHVLKAFVYAAASSASPDPSHEDIVRSSQSSSGRAAQQNNPTLQLAAALAPRVNDGLERAFPRNQDTCHDFLGAMRRVGAKQHDVIRKQLAVPCITCLTAVYSFS